MPAAASDAAISPMLRSSAPQRQHLVADLAGGFVRPFRARLGLAEGIEFAGAQQGGHLMHRGGGVAEPVGHLGGGGLVDEVGPQRLVAALPRTAGRGEVLRSPLNWIPAATCTYGRAVSSMASATRRAILL